MSGAASNSSHIFRLLSRDSWLLRECIPDPYSHVVEIRTPRISLIHQIRSAQRLNGETQWYAPLLKSKTHARTGLRVIRPILPEHIDSPVSVPIHLGVKRADLLSRSQRVPRAILRIEQGVVAKAADKNAIVIGLGE